MKVFVSYAKEDYKVAKKIYDDLKRIGISPWLDTEDLKPGQNWREGIQLAIKESDYFITLLSTNSISKKGFVQKEQKKAFEILNELPSFEIFIIPVRLNDCNPADEKLQDIHWVDLYPSYDKGLDKIITLFKSHKSFTNHIIFQHNKNDEVKNYQHAAQSKLAFGIMITVVVIATIIIAILHLINFDIKKQQFNDGMNSLSESLIEEIIKTKKKNVMIKNFQNFNDTETPLGKYVAENLISCINIRDKSITFVNRYGLKDIMEEISFQHSELSDSKNINKLGNFINAQLIITGKTESSNNEITVSVTLTDIESNKSVISRTCKMYSDQMINSITGNNQQFSKCLIAFLDKMRIIIVNSFRWFWVIIIVTISGFIWILRRRKFVKALNKQ